MSGVAVAVTLAFAACGGDGVDPELESNEFGPNPEEVEFAASLGIDLNDMTKSMTGLYYRDDPVGTGELAATGDVVSLTYTGWLVDGTQFDSGGLDLITVGGPPALIAGFTEGIIGMQQGGTRTVVIPAALAYGSQGAVSIPSNAVIVFEITLTTLIKP
jgi:FKBP-type peptidyl-prolyl cis-trans isomerase FkpA